MLVTVNVTREDIQEGRSCSSLSCPVARAVNRVLNGHWRAAVGYPAIHVENILCLRQGHKLPTPRPVIAFARAFDRDEPVTPFSFDLEIPDECLPPSK